MHTRMHTFFLLTQADPDSFTSIKKKKKDYERNRKRVG